MPVFFPKRTNFRQVSWQQIQVALENLNNRPRKTRGYRTPNQLFHNQFVTAGEAINYTYYLNSRGTNHGRNSHSPDTSSTWISESNLAFGLLCAPISTMMACVPRRSSNSRSPGPLRCFHKLSASVCAPRLRRLPPFALFHPFG